ncbi:hypothetical protein [Microbacterium sp. ANT_H45B]|uniref:hypothetical protein n=1 Tax=Microbacterium sp. ANT_H45B TaxID=2597346 RepID=UPI00165E83EF|nr:hypothetical protein [Microbacterium sp. ANT_H45B]
MGRRTDRDPSGAMVTKYVFATLLGVAVAIATAPTLDQVTSASYSSFWALGMVLTGTVATIGSTRKKWWRIEFSGAMCVVALLAVYAFAPIVLIFGGDVERLAYSVILLGFMVFPTTRIVTLIRRGGSDA